MITVIILCIIFFALGGAFTYVAIAAGIYAAAKDGEFAGAFYSKKRNRWEVIGNYLAISGKLANLLKLIDAHEHVHYVDLDSKPKSKSPASKRFKVKLGIKRSGKGWRLGKNKSGNFKQSE